MAEFKNEAIVEYPVERIFDVILAVAKRDFEGFSEENAIGTSVEKTVGSYAAKTTTMKVEITNYKRNEIYEVTSSKGDKVFVSRYTFEKIDDNKTNVIFEDSESAQGFVGGLNSWLVGLFYKKRVKQRFGYLIKGLISEIEKNSSDNEITA